MNDRFCVLLDIGQLAIEFSKMNAIVKKGDNDLYKKMKEAHEMGFSWLHLMWIAQFAIQNGECSFLDLLEFLKTKKMEGIKVWT